MSNEVEVIVSRDDINDMDGQVPHCVSCMENLPEGSAAIRTDTDWWCVSCWQTTGEGKP